MITSEETEKNNNTAITFHSALLGACLSVLLFEAVNPACSVNKLLLASIKWMTLGTDFNHDFFSHSGLGFKLIPTRAADLGIVELWMDIFFHYKPPEIIKTRVNISSRADWQVKIFVTV